MKVLGRLIVLLATVLAAINSLGCEGLFSEVPRYVGVEVEFVDVAAGAAHTCALAEDGNVYCWGSGESGRLGDGRTTESATPVLVSGREFAGEVTDLAVGEDHSCVVASKEVYCWGANDQKQSGQVSSDDVTVPRRVSGLDEPVRIALGAAFSCARQADGEVRCWGKNSQGQFGNDSRDSTHTPQKVLNIEAVELLAAGGGSQLLGGYSGHACAVSDEPSTGALWCWGSGDDGQLGYAEGETKLQPERVHRMEEPVVSLCAGSNHSCAVDDEGQVYCWGRNTAGKLGFGKYPSPNLSTHHTSETPKIVKNIESAERVFCGGDFNCALADGDVYCWGRNRAGQLAIDSDGNPSANTPQVITGLGEVDTVATGARHVCAIERGGRLYCWGAGEQGQLGPESEGEDSHIPRRVRFPE